MILKSAIVSLVLSVVCSDVSGAPSAYTNVYVHSNSPEVLPLEYISYGAPVAPFANPQIAQLSAAPVGSVLPLPQVSTLLSPCVAPCVSSPVAAVPNAKILTYNTPKDDTTSYEYSYVVYDENTGDHKAQRELSDGSVVRGQYSLLQPDGYVREVQYTADDSKGFNAVVKNYLQDTTKNEERKPKAGPKKESVPPCNEVKNEPLIEAKKEELSEEKKEPVHKEQEVEILEKGKDNAREKLSSEKKEESSLENFSIDKKEVGHNEEVLTEKKEETSAGNGSAEKIEKNTEKKTPEKEDESTKDKENPKESVSETENHALVSYNDVIKCVQSAVDKANKGSIPKPAVSPLTYIILPGANKPC